MRTTITEPKICRKCLSVAGIDDVTWHGCVNGEDHRWVKATVEDCKYLRRTETGRVSPRRIREADRDCAMDERYHGPHHYGDSERRHFKIKWPQKGDPR